MVYAIYFEVKNKEGEFDQDLLLATCINDLNEILRTFTTDPNHLDNKSTICSSFTTEEGGKVFWKEV